MITLSIISTICGIILVTGLYLALKALKATRQQVIELTFIYTECTEENAKLKVELEDAKAELEKAKKTKATKKTK